MQNYDLKSSDIFQDRDEGYFNFIDAIDEKSKIREYLENSNNFKDTDIMIQRLVTSWYDTYQSLVDEKSSDIATLYQEGYALIEKAFEKQKYEVLDRFKVRGIFASWWVENKFTLKSIKNSGYDHLLLSDAYLSNNAFFIHALDEEAAKLHPKLLELFKKLKTSKEENDKAVLRDKIAEMKTKIFENIKDEKALVVDMLKQDALSFSERYLSEKKQEIIGNIENLWDKYQVSLSEIEKERDEATEAIKGFLTELGYQ